MKYFYFIFLFIFISKIYSNVFINTIPFGASVFINNNYAGKTPLLIKNLSTNNIKILFKKDGYYNNEITVSNIKGITNINIFLTDTKFSIKLQDKSYVIIDEKEYKVDNIRNLTYGFYEFKPKKNSLLVKRINPNKNFLYTSLAITGLTLTSGLLSQFISDYFYNNYKISTNINDLMNNMQLTLFFDNFKIGSYTLAGICSLFSIYFFIDDINYNNNNQPKVLTEDEFLTEDKKLYQNGMDYLNNFDYTNATVILNSLIEKFPESQYVPIILWKLGNISKQEKNYKNAIQYYEKLIKEYPVYDLYEIALKELGEINYINSNYISAINYFSELTNYRRYYKKYYSEYNLIKCYNELIKIENKQEYKKILKELIDNFIIQNEYPDNLKEEMRNYYEK